MPDISSLLLRRVVARRSAMGSTNIGTSIDGGMHVQNDAYDTYAPNPDPGGGGGASTVRHLSRSQCRLSGSRHRRLSGVADGRPPQFCTTVTDPHLRPPRREAFRPQTSAMSLSITRTPGDSIQLNEVDHYASTLAFATSECRHALFLSRLRSEPGGGPCTHTYSRAGCIPCCSDGPLLDAEPRDREQSRAIKAQAVRPSRCGWPGFDGRPVQ